MEPKEMEIYKTMHKQKEKTKKQKIRNHRDEKYNEIYAEEFIEGTFQRASGEDTTKWKIESVN